MRPTPTSVGSRQGTVAALGAAPAGIRRGIFLEAVAARVAAPAGDGAAAAVVPAEAGRAAVADLAAGAAGLAAAAGRVVSEVPAVDPADGRNGAALAYWPAALATAGGPAFTAAGAKRSPK